MTSSIHGNCGLETISSNRTPSSQTASIGSPGLFWQVAVSERLDAEQRQLLSGFERVTVEDLHSLLRTPLMRETLWWKVRAVSSPVLHEISSLSMNLLSDASPGQTALLLPFFPQRILTRFVVHSSTVPGATNFASGDMPKKHGITYNLDFALESIPSKSLLPLLDRLGF
jgi:hypothetical protein